MSEFSKSFSEPEKPAKVTIIVELEDRIVTFHIPQALHLKKEDVFADPETLDEVMGLVPTQIEKIIFSMYPKETSDGVAFSISVEDKDV